MSKKDVFPGANVMRQENPTIENREINSTHHTAGDKTQRTLVNEPRPNGGSQSPTNISPAQHAVRRSSTRISRSLAPRTKHTGRSMPGIVARQRPRNRKLAPIPNKLQLTLEKVIRKQELRKKSKHNPLSPPAIWRHVAPMNGRMPSLDNVLQ